MTLLSCLSLKKQKSWVAIIVMLSAIMQMRLAGCSNCTPSERPLSPFKNSFSLASLPTPTLSPSSVAWSRGSLLHTASG
eukprot:349544-Rhodomonas_salina.3